MSRIIKIYCEGKAGSHDFDILSKVISNLKSSQIQIDPIGSVRGAGAIIAYKESGSVKSDFKLFFRDRDFDKAIPDEPVLENDESKKYLYYSYRNTIENYLFSPKCLFDFILEKKLSQYGVNNESEAKQKLIEAAGKIRYYQAVRHTMGKMRTDKTNFDTKWTEKSGILPKNLDENHCKQKAWERIKTSKTFTDEWTIEKFDEILAYFLAKFDAGFMNNLDFLVYFQGKDFESSLTATLPNFPLKDFYSYAKRHFDFTHFPDLVQLRKIIEDNL